MPRRAHLAALSAASLIWSLLPLSPIASPAAAAAPTRILNDGSQNAAGAQWVETQSVADTGNLRTYVASFVVELAAGRRITQALGDLDWDATVDANTALTIASNQFYGSGTTNFLETSRVTVAFTASPPDVSGRGDSPIRIRLVDDIGASTQTVSANLHVADASNSGPLGPDGAQDYPRLTAASQSATEVVPGMNIAYTFSCQDVDLDFFSSDDDCDRANIRWRRLHDGATSAISLKTGMNDDTTTSHTMSFPSRGYYVVEAQLGNENAAFPDTGNPSGGWWRLGNAVVNDSASSLTGSLSFSGVNPSSPPSVNEDSGTVNAVATVSDTGGAVQVIEWDALNDGSFERRESTVPVLSGGDLVHVSLSSSELSQAISTTNPGLVTTTARITDNGAFDGAENIRRQLTFSGQLRINARPTASNVNASTNENTAVAITLVGNDTDAQPQALTYEIVTPPSASAGSLGPISGNQVTFTPAADYSGPASFTYRVRDGGPSTVAAWTHSNTATVSITVHAVNNPPTVDAKSATTIEDTPVSIQATGSDAEGPLTWSVASQPTNGTAACNATSGLCTYSPAANFFGSDSFVVRGTDSGGLSATATFSVTVSSVNDAPVADDQSVTVAEDAVAFPISVTASDVDDASLTFTAPVDDVDHGTLSCSGGSCTYSPSANYNGPDSFTFSVSDGQQSDTGTVSIAVTPVNDDPVATDVPGAATDEDVPVSLTLGGTDIDGDAVTVSAVTDPANGNATIQGPNLVEYVGDQHFHGLDTFDFTATDGQGGFDTGTVVVTVAPVNDAPVVDDQTFLAVEDTPLTISVAAGDADGDTLIWSIVTPPVHGDVSGTGADVGYAPDPNFEGTDSFVVRVADGHGASDTALITVEVAAVNDQPVANPISVTVAEDSSVGFSLAASDADGDALTFSAPVLGPSHGEVACTGAACEYTPDPDFNGADVFTFLVDDGNGGTDVACVSITVTPVNDAPVAVGATVSTSEDTPLAITLIASDVDGDLLTYSPDAPAHGTLEGIAPDVVYVPSPNFHGSDGFGFGVSDGHGGTASATVAITVDSVNDAPLAVDTSVTTSEEVPVDVALLATDVDGDSITFTIVGGPANGSIVLTGDVARYTPAVDFEGVDTFIYRAADPSGAFTDAQATVVVLPRYEFVGFFQPVDNLPTLNKLKAGSAVPIKFSLTGDQGLDIFTVGYPTSIPIACDSGAPLDGIEETVTAGGSSLSYDPASDQYVYVWKTSKAWAGTCRQFVLGLDDGSFYRANFKF